MVNGPSSADLRAGGGAHVMSGGVGASPDSGHPETAGEKLCVRDAPRVIGDLGRDRAGPMLVCIGSLHGNEPAGFLALRRVFKKLGPGPEGLEGLEGRFVGLTGNRKALAVGQRFLELDLNRAWTPERIDRVRRTTEALVAEDDELRELSLELDFLLEDGRDAMVLDLHSTSGGGPAFTNLDDTLRNRRFAFRIPVPHVLGLEEELAGTLAGHLNERRIVAIGFEAGQHADPRAVDRAEAAVWIALEHSGVLRPGTRPEVDRALRSLRKEHAPFPNVVEVRYRHAVEPGDGFAMLPGFTTFQRVRRGQELAREPAGPVTACESGRILMPLYQGQGEDGFFLVREVQYAWLRLSAVLRRLGADRFLHWLPGVRRHPGRPRTYVVDRRRARWLARQVFHLLGYRRAAEDGVVLTMTRRD